MFCFDEPEAVKYLHAVRGSVRMAQSVMPDNGALQQYGVLRIIYGNQIFFDHFFNPRRSWCLQILKFIPVRCSTAATHPLRIDAYTFDG